MFHLSPAERKTLLVAGAAGGMAAIFASPVAAVLLAVELLLFEWKPRSFIPVALAAATAGALRIPLMGAGPIFPVTPHAALGSEGLILALVVGIIAGLASGVLTTLVYAFEDLFTKLPIHWMWWPAIGGLFVGIGGYIDPRVLGVGYETIHGLLRGELIGPLVAGLLIGKALVWSISLGSGTSGGVLAPLLIMGGALGALEARWLPMGDAGLWAMISMAAMMGGTMRSPLTAMVFTLELTHDLNLLPGMLVACIAAHAVTVLALRRSILTEKIARRGFHINREYVVDPLMGLRVSEAMDLDAPTIPASMKVSELADRLAKRDRQLSRRQGTLIIDEGGSLCGIITRGDVLRAIDEFDDPNLTVIQAGSRNLIVTYPDEILYEAIEKMLRNDIGRLPVVNREDSHQVLGYLGRAAVMKARLHRMQEDQEREPGWLQGLA
jgi:CBS domain-containing protein